MLVGKLILLSSSSLFLVRILYIQVQIKQLDALLVQILIQI